MYYIYGQSGPSLLIESTDSDDVIRKYRSGCGMGIRLGVWLPVPDFFCQKVGNYAPALLYS